MFSRKFILELVQMEFLFTIFTKLWNLSFVGIDGNDHNIKICNLFQFQTNPNNEEDELLLDANTLFVVDVIQESLLQDSFSSSLILEPNNRIFEENAIRSNINGLIDYKAPALISMLRLILGDENNDFIHIAAKGLFISRFVVWFFSFLSCHFTLVKVVFKKMSLKKKLPNFAWIVFRA